MTPDQYRTTLAALDLSQARLGRLLGASQSTTSRWALGERAVPQSVALLLWALAAGLVRIDQLEALARTVGAGRLIKGGAPEIRP